MPAVAPLTVPPWDNSAMDGYAVRSADEFHKRLGITARGAWVAIARHFRELGVDIQTDPVTVVGIGDMSGDVFGNGMLLSPHIRMVGAFNHQHVFVDPDPDPAASFEERKRLFALARWGGRFVRESRLAASLEAGIIDYLYPGAQPLHQALANYHREA